MYYANENTLHARFEMRRDNENARFGSRWKMMKNQYRRENLCYLPQMQTTLTGAEPGDVIGRTYVTIHGHDRLL